MTTTRVLRPALAALLVALASCEDPTPPADPFGGSMQIIAGDGQSGRAGQALAQPVRVRVVSSSQRFVEGYPLGFAVVEGGGTVSAGQVRTNSRGEAAVTWTLGSTPGAAQALEIRGDLSISPHELRVTATATP